MPPRARRGRLARRTTRGAEFQPNPGNGADAQLSMMSPYSHAPLFICSISTSIPKDSRFSVVTHLPQHPVAETPTHHQYLKNPCRSTPCPKNPLQIPGQAGEWGGPRRLAAGGSRPYPHAMCRNITKEQQIEGWRAAAELLAGLRRRGIGIAAAAFAARLRRGVAATAVKPVRSTMIAR